MSTKQPGLFGDAQPEEQNPFQFEPTTSRDYESFLPGVKAQECYPDIHEYQQLKAVAQDCQGCQLRGTCRQVVFGQGRADSLVMLVGEGPGKDEDEQGQPFVGRAGQLLDKILTAAELPRPDVYITNVVKCRPPGNRIPNPDEVKQCKKFLEAQVRIIKPSIVVCLGALASQVVIDPKARISRVRGRWFLRNNIKIMATFHPAALLRNEAYKRPTWEDFKLIRDQFKKLSSAAR